ncbi:hypothetical protein JHK86_039676 [Glycine max]|nr:hypothetical protein JHK86_039676 [Glycine max]
MKKLPPSAEIPLNACGHHMTVLRQFGPPLQWPVETLNPGIAAKAIAQPWYDFLVETDFDHGDEVSFYYRPFDKVWEIVIRRQKDWDDSDTH